MSSLLEDNGQVFSVDKVIEGSGWGYQHVLVVCLCMLVNMIDGFDITAMAVVVSDVGDEMGVEANKLGLLFSFSLAGMMLGATFLASLSDVFGRRVVITASLFVVAFSVLMTAYSDSLVALIFFRFISGLGAGAMLASQTALTSEYSPKKYRSLSVAIVVAGYPLGAMLTGIVAEFTVSTYGWRSIFLAGGWVTLCIAMFALKFLPESLQFLVQKRPSNALDKINKVLSNYPVELLHKLPPNQSVMNSTAGSDSTLSKMSSLLTQEYRFKSMILWVAFTSVMCTLYFLLSWLPKLLVNAGLSPQIANTAFSVFNFGGVAGIFIMGVLTTKLKLFNVVFTFLLLAVGFMCALSLTLNLSAILLPLIFVIGITLQGGFTGLYAIAAETYPTKIRGTGVGWALGVGRLGAVIGPLVAGYLIAGNMQLGWLFLLFAIPLSLGAFCIYALKVMKS